MSEPPCPETDDETAVERLADLLNDRVLRYAEAHPDEPAEDWLYAIFDAWVAERSASDLPVLDCRAGCDHCCYQGVMVTSFEARFLAESIARNWPSADVRSLRAELHALWDEQRAGGLERLPLVEQVEALSRLRRPCPLLDRSTGLCRVYPARPLACRREHSTDVGVCRQHREDPDAPVASLRVARIEAAWNAARRLVQSWADEPEAASLYWPLELALGLALDEVCPHFP